MSLRMIIPCKYSSISDFDEEDKVTVTNTKGEKKVMSLQYFPCRRTVAVDAL